MKKLEKYVKKMSKAFATFDTQLQRPKGSDSDLSDSEGEDEASHLYIGDINFGKSNFQFTYLDEEFEPYIASIFNQISGCNSCIQNKLELMEVIIL